MYTRREFEEKRKIFSELTEQDRKEIVEEAPPSLRRELNDVLDSFLLPLDEVRKKHFEMEIWENWNLVSDHPGCKDDELILMSPSGKVFKPEDIDPTPDRFNQTELAKALGVTTAAIRDRMSRGTVPDYDGTTPSGRGFWFVGTVCHLIKTIR